MSTSGHAPGSRAIKIPLHRPNTSSEYSTPSRRRLPRTSRLESTNDEPTYSPASSSASGSASASSSRSRDHNSLRKTQNTIASPSEPIHRTNSSQSYTINAPQRKDKQRATSRSPLAPPSTVADLPLPTASTQPQYPSTLSPSMLTSSSYKSINLNSYHDPSSGPARLITYTKHSQGFTWNDELFLPSYLVGRRYRSGGGRGRYRRYGYDDEDEDEMDLDDDSSDGRGAFDEEGEKCPVYDVFVTDEEAARMLP